MATEAYISIVVHMALWIFIFWQAETPEERETKRRWRQERKEYLRSQSNHGLKEVEWWE